MDDFTSNDFTSTDMIQVLQDGMWIGSRTETMSLLFICIILLIVFSVWYEFFTEPPLNSNSKSSQEIKDVAKKAAKGKRSL